MSDSGMAPYPQVFVVDGQASWVSVPTGKKARWSGMGQNILFILMGLAMLGLVVQASLIYSLYRKVEAFSHCMSHPFCQNQSSPKTPHQQFGTLGLVGSKGHNDVSTGEAHVGQIQKLPFAQLMGCSSHVGDNNAVQWEYKSDENYRMGYRNGRLLIEMEGFYYIYSKLTVNAAEECSVVQHKVTKVTKAYGEPIELLQSRSSRCSSTTRNTGAQKSSSVEDLRNSFLAGIFQLQRGDEIYVTVNNITKIYRGNKENVMGAFMIAPLTA